MEDIVVVVVVVVDDDGCSRVVVGSPPVPAVVVVVAVGLCSLPADLTWRHITGVGLLAGIGFTMSIFITNLAFVGQPEVINAAKMAILVASASAGMLGMLWLVAMAPKRLVP